MRKVFKLLYYQNVLRDSNKILHSDNDYQILVVGRPKFAS